MFPELVCSRRNNRRNLIPPGVQPEEQCVLIDLRNRPLRFSQRLCVCRFLELIRKNPDKKIFVHCRRGNDRTGMMIAAYRMGAQGWTADQAMKEMHFFGYTAVHHLMCPGLAGYEKSFPQRLKTSSAFRELR